MPEGLQIDPVSEDAANVAFDLIDGTSTFLLEAAYPPPDRDQMWAGSADTEGDPLVQTRFKNRQITIKVRVVGASASALQTTLGQLEQKIGKLGREGGTLKRTAPSGSTVVFDVLGATSDIPIDRRHLNLNKSEVSLTFDAKPFGRLAPVTLSSHAEATLPVLVFTETAIAGDVPALGRLTVTEVQGADQFWLTWGLQSRYYDSAATAALAYEAESRTALGTATTAVGPAGASGGGSNTILSASLTPTAQAIMSTQASGGGAHLTHVGSFRMYARVQTPVTNSGLVSIALQWSVGDFRRVTTNAAVSFPADTYDGAWRLVDLGQVNIPKVATGAQRWEGRIIASSATAVLAAPTDVIYIDHVFLVPVAEGSGVASASAVSAAAMTVLSSDGFNQAAGNLNGKTASVGGTWATSGSTTDLAVVAGTTNNVQRSTVSDASARLAVLGTGVYAAIAVQVDLTTAYTGRSSTVYTYQTGVLARYVDSSNYLSVVFGPSPSGAVTINKTIAGITTALGGGTFTASGTYTLKVAAFASGRWVAWIYPPGGTPGSVIASGTDTALATGGTLASGKVGLYDMNSGSRALTRTYDNFLAATPISDAAIFGSEQAQIRYDGVIRQDPSGSFWQPVSKYEGDYLLIPPAGREARSLRVIVKASRNDLTTGTDSNIDDISAQLVVTPRVLVLPE